MSQAAHNVDQAEISKFEELAARWWDPNSEFKPLHDINPLRLDYIDQRAPLTNCKVIDVGTKHYIIEVTGDEGKLQALIYLLKPMGIEKIARSGSLALYREPK